MPRPAAPAGLVQSLASWFLREAPFMPAEDDYMVYTYNRFQACRFGLEAVYVDPVTGTHMPLREHLLHTLDRIAPHAQALGAGAGPEPAGYARGAMGEFELIEHFFRRPVRRSPLGVGDDCALLAPAPGTQLAVSTDMLVEGRHFFPGTDARRLGHKCLAVNLSDLAACGAQPLAFTLALALPEADPRWLEPFSQGLLALADAHGCELVGGDTTRGPLTISVTVFGEVPAGRALLRSGARAGDDVYVSGSLGDARMALGALRGEWPAGAGMDAATLEAARARLEAPTPRVALGLALRGVATAAIDVSDGLLGDLGHVLKASGVGATIDADAVSSLMASGGALDAGLRRRCTLAGGDDYELAFAAPATARKAVLAAAAQAGTRVSRIGRIEAAPGLRLVDGSGRPVEGCFGSFDHFADAP